MHMDTIITAGARASAIGLAHAKFKAQCEQAIATYEYAGTPSERLRALGALASAYVHADVLNADAPRQPLELGLLGVTSPTELELRARHCRPAQIPLVLSQVLDAAIVERERFSGLRILAEMHVHGSGEPTPERITAWLEGRGFPEAHAYGHGRRLARKYRELAASGSPRAFHARLRALAAYDAGRRDVGLLPAALLVASQEPARATSAAMQTVDVIAEAYGVHLSPTGARAVSELALKLRTGARNGLGFRFMTRDYAQARVR